MSKTFQPSLKFVVRPGAREKSFIVHATDVSVNKLESLALANLSSLLKGLPVAKNDSNTGLHSIGELLAFPKVTDINKHSSLLKP